MDLAGVLFLAGVLVVLVARLGPRFSTTLRDNERWVAWVGVVLVVVGAILGAPELFRGLKEGFNAAK